MGYANTMVQVSISEVVRSISCSTFPWAIMPLAVVGNQPGKQWISMILYSVPPMLGRQEEQHLLLPPTPPLHPYHPSQQLQSLLHKSTCLGLHPLTVSE